LKASSNRTVNERKGEHGGEEGQRHLGGLEADGRRALASLEGKRNDGEGGVLDTGFTTKPYHTCDGWFCGWCAAKHFPPLGYIVRRIVLAVARPRVSIRVTGLGFEPFAVCGLPTRALAFARYRLYH